MGNPEYQSVGNKGLYRHHISMMVLNAFEAKRSLYNSLKLKIEPQHSVINYKHFISAFAGLFDLVSFALKNEKFRSTVHQFLYKSEHNFQNLDESKEKFASTTSYAMILFEKFILEMKQDGIYDPTIFFKYDLPQNAWEDSF